jgi:hypothetical protein
VEQAARRESAVVFAFVNAQEAMKRVYRIAGQNRHMMSELAVAQGFFDLAHLNSLSLAIGSTPDDLRADFVMSLAEGQTNMVYNLVRTPPMRGRVLAMTPASAAAVLAIGINPEGSPSGTQQVATQTQTVQAITGLDLGRELFANIREASIFVLAPDGVGGGMGPNLPDVGMVLAVGNADKSEALWTYLLSLPGRAQGKADQVPATTTVSGVEVQAFPMDQGVSVHFARTKGAIVVGLTPRVIKEVIAVRGEGRGVLEEPVLRTGTAQLAEDTSVALIGHFGRLAQVARSVAPHEVPAAIGLLAEAAPNAMITVQADESPTRLRLAGNLSGIPAVEDVLAVLAEAGVLVRADVAHVSHTPIAATEPE